MHVPESIVLLCPNHHAEVTKGVIPKSVVANASRDPAAVRAGYSHRSLPWFSDELMFKVGGLVTRGTPIPFMIRDAVPVMFEPPRDGGHATTISASIDDPNGVNILRVENDEWQVRDATSDFEWIGNRYIFRSQNKQVVLQLRFDAPGLLAIERLLTVIKGLKVEATEDSLEIGGRNVPMMRADYCGAGLIIG
jgi:hypothetical protein